jgi:hypothetical protein
LDLGITNKAYREDQVQFEEELKRTEIDQECESLAVGTTVGG